MVGALGMPAPPAMTRKHQEKTETPRNGGYWQKIHVGPPAKRFTRERSVFFYFSVPNAGGAVTWTANHDSQGWVGIVGLGHVTLAQIETNLSVVRAQVAFEDRPRAIVEKQADLEVRRAQVVEHLQFHTMVEPGAGLPFDRLIDLD